MPFIVDDIAVAAVTAEAATATTGSVAAFEATTAATGTTALETTSAAELTTSAESTVATEVTPFLDVAREGTPVTEIPIDGDIISPESKISGDLSDTVFVDEFPIPRSPELPSEIGGLDGNVFYDEFPSESGSVADNIPKGSQEEGTEITSETATDAGRETAVDSVSDGMNEGISEVDNEITSKTVPECYKESPTDVTDITNDKIGESTELNTLDQSVENFTDVKPDVINEPSPKDVEAGTLPETENVNKAEVKDSTTPEEIDDSPRTIKTINDGLAGQNHPDTGVPYVEKVVETDTGEKVKGVFPQFESKVEIQLPKELYQSPDRTQFAECNKQLQEKVASNPELRTQFTEDQLADIEDGITPEGYTWHHNEEIGKMQLVDSDIHSQTRHTGGRNIWGGGTENRH